LLRHKSCKIVAREVYAVSRREGCSFLIYIEKIYLLVVR
jgi:hypothetical protein